MTPSGKVVPQPQGNAVSCGQTSVAMALSARTQHAWSDASVNARYGFALLQALQDEDPTGRWRDEGNITDENSWAHKVKPALKAGWPVIVGLNGPEFSPSGHGHIVLLVSVDANGIVKFANPNGGIWGSTTVARILECAAYPGGKFVFAPSGWLPVSSGLGQGRPLTAGDNSSVRMMAPGKPIDMSALKSIQPEDVATKPNIVSCGSWGARAPKVNSPRIYPRDFILHHMDTPNRAPSSDHASAFATGRELALQCQAAHMDSDYLIPGGASDTGHHFTATVDGVVFEGRHGSAIGLLTGGLMPEGAQCYGFNNSTVGQEHEGDYTAQIPNAKLLVASLTVSAWAAMVWGLDSHTNFQGHRDDCATACPGDAFYAALPAYRDLLRGAVLLLRSRWTKSVTGVWVNKY